VVDGFDQICEFGVGLNFGVQGKCLDLLNHHKFLKPAFEYSEEN